MTQRITIDIGGKRVSVPAPPSAVIARLRSELDETSTGYFKRLRDGVSYFHPLEGEVRTTEGQRPHGENNLISAHTLGGGMSVRNWLRQQPECKDWDCHDLDNVWITIVEAAVRE